MNEPGPYRRHVRKRYSLLRRDLRADEIVAILYQEGFLTEEERDDITTTRTPQKKNQKLLDILTSERACECFFEALGITAQEHFQEGFREESQPSHQNGEDTELTSTASELLTSLEDFDSQIYNTITRKKFQIWREDGYTPEMIVKLCQSEKRVIDEKVCQFSLPEHKPPKGFLRPEKLNLVFLGRTGDGKSTTANTLIGEDIFEANAGDTSVTQAVSAHEFYFEGCRVRVVDTPGLADEAIPPADIALLLAKVLDVCPEGVHAFLYVHNSTDYRYTAEQHSVKETILDIFGLEILEHTAVILTHAGTGLNDVSLAEYLARNTEGNHVFSEKEIHKRVIAVENKAEPLYQRECMRARMFKLIDYMMSRVGNKIYTSHHFASARSLKELSELKCVHALKDLKKRNQLKFEQAFRIAKCDAMEVVSEMSEKESAMFKDQQIRRSNLLLCELEAKLRGYLEERSDSLWQLDRLSTESGGPVWDILRECLHLHNLQHQLEQAREQGSETDEVKYRALIDLHDSDDLDELMEKEKRHLASLDDGTGQVEKNDILSGVKQVEQFLRRKNYYVIQINLHLENVDKVIKARVTEFILGAHYEELSDEKSAENTEKIYQKVRPRLSAEEIKYCGEQELKERIANVMQNNCEKIKSSSELFKYKTWKQLKRCTIL